MSENGVQKSEVHFRFLHQGMLAMRLYLSRMEQTILAVLLLVILGALFALSYAYGRRQRENADVPFLQQAAAPDSVTPPATDAPTPINEIVVHVTGAVKRSGVYRFLPGMRVIDAIRQAGGAREDGYPDGLNLAARLEDGERIAVPTKTEWLRLTTNHPLPLVVTGAADPLHAPPVKGAVAKPEVKESGTPAHANAGPKPLPAKKINLNTASQEELMTLPGIGAVSARRILDQRKQQGKFTDPAQLLDVPGIGPKTYEKIAPYIEL